MYEDTKSSIDWKGLFLKVIIVFLVVLIAVKGYSVLKGKDTNKNNKVTTSQTADSKNSSTFTENIEKLKSAGENYFKENRDKLPTTEGNTVMVTLNELVNNGKITELTDENGKTCDGESSYVTAMLEGTKTKIKANLVCGSASSYSLVYMSESDNKVDENTTVTKTTNSSSSSSKNSATKTSNCTSTNCNGSVSVNVSTNTTATQSVTINPSNTKSSQSYTPSSKTTKKVTVSFNSNGGNRNYSSQTINVNERAYNPGSTNKSGYTFLGWYLNGKKYDFSTPVTENITLTAKFEKNNYYYDDDSLKSGTYTSYVYTMGWNTIGTNYVDITHTLKIPKEIRNKDIQKIKISSISFYQSLNTTALGNTFKDKHASTFIYSNNGWEAYNTTGANYSTIKSSAVDFYYSTSYKYYNDAINNGFDVNWTADNVYSQCSKTFAVNGETNKCGYGIVYKVKWTYQYYN